MTSPIHIMLDLETTGLAPTAGIVQIGACVFDATGTKDTFMERINPRILEKSGYTIDLVTMKWWDRQDPELRRKVFGGTLPPANAISRFKSWVDDQCNGAFERVCLWSNHIDFDLPILKNAFHTELYSYPFDFRKHMDCATLFRVSPQFLDVSITNGQKHDALGDAIYQAQQASTILRELSAGGYTNVFNSVP